MKEAYKLLSVLETCLCLQKSYVIAVGVLAVSVYLYVIPAPINPEPYYYPKPLPVLQGPLSPNLHLQKAERTFEGIIVGPESFAVDQNGTIYTGTADGRIMAFKGTQIREVVRTGKNATGCGTFKMEPICGRPKGMKINPADPEGHLLFLDSYHGLFELDTQTGETDMLISSKEGVNGVPFYFLNALDISREGIVYFTDSSTKWDRRNYRYEVIEMNKQGRLIEYNTVTKTTRLLLDNMYLANGVALSSDESVLVISEMSACRLRRYYLSGSKAGQSDILIDNLPGYPDNIKLNGRGNFYVGLGSVRFEGVSMLGPFLDLVGPYPAVKRFLTKIIPLQLFDIFLPKHSMVLEIDINGNIIHSLHDPGAKVIRAAGEMFEHNGTLYIGSFWAPYVGQLSLETSCGKM